MIQRNMQTKGLWILLIGSVVAGFLVGAACQTPPKHAVDEGGASAEAALSSIPIRERGGAQLWGDNCARCHNSRSPSEFTDEQWEVIAHHMRVRANLTAYEHEMILKFLQSAN